MGLESLNVSLVNLDEDAPRPPRDRPAQARTLAEREIRKDLGLTTPARAERIACEGCTVEKEPEEYSRYLKIMGSLDSDEAPAMLCDYCAVYGPPLSDPFHQLTPRELRSLESLAAGGSINAAAKIMKVSRTQLKALIRGESDDKPFLRQAYKRLMISLGASPRKIAEVFHEGLSADKHQWNSEQGVFQAFPDHSNRMKAAAAIQKVLDLDAPQEKAAEAAVGGGNTFNFVTNLDGRSKVVEEGYTIIDARGETVDE